VTWYGSPAACTIDEAPNESERQFSASFDYTLIVGLFALNSGIRNPLWLFYRRNGGMILGNRLQNHDPDLMRGNMSIEYDEKGKIFTDIISKISISATVQTTTHMLRGHIHVRRDQRIKDELDQDQNFLALTDVSVLGPDGQTLFQSPFLAVRRTHIVWVIPEQTPGEEKGS